MVCKAGAVKCVTLQFLEAPLALGELQLGDTAAANG
jgi:hypothetical protein